jgi:hypothetical protein
LRSCRNPPLLLIAVERTNLTGAGSRIVINPYKFYLHAHTQPCWSWTQRRSIQLKEFVQSMEGIIHGKARRINT